MLNNRVSQIKITWQIQGQRIDFLDLTFYKGKRFAREHVLDVAMFQKNMNCYLYIPAFSYHPVHVKKAFITSELRRYLLRSTHESDFTRVKTQFYHRLRARGYSKEFLAPLFTSCVFSLRPSLMQRACLSRDQALPGRDERPLVLKLDYEPRSAQLHLHPLLHQLATTLHSTYPSVYPARIIRAWRLPRKFHHTLVRARMEPTSH